MQRVQLFRCRICGDPYIGFEPPTNCPFCGAHEDYMVPSEEWKDTNRVNLTEVSRKNLNASLELEISNAEFYLCISRVSKDEHTRALFKALSKVEAEHASTICKILRTEKPKIEFRKSLCSSDDGASLQDADHRENRAVKLYSEFLKQAEEPRVKELFTALIEIESDHIDILGNEMSEPVENQKENPVNQDLEKLDKEEHEFYESYSVHED